MQSLANAKSFQKFEIQETIHHERGSQARGLYPTQGTSRMRTARVKHEEETDTREIVKK